MDTGKCAATSTRSHLLHLARRRRARRRTRRELTAYHTQLDGGSPRRHTGGLTRTSEHASWPVNFGFQLSRRPRTYSTEVQQRPLTAASTSDRPHPAVSWDSGQTPSGAASSGRRGLPGGRIRHGLGRAAWPAGRRAAALGYVIAWSRAIISDWLPSQSCPAISPKVSRVPSTALTTLVHGSVPLTAWADSCHQHQ